MFLRCHVTMPVACPGSLAVSKVRWAAMFFCRALCWALGSCHQLWLALKFERADGQLAAASHVFFALQTCHAPSNKLDPSCRAVQTGAAFGGMVGMHLIQLLPPWWNIQPGVYALVACSAMLGGVFRSAISLVSLVCLTALQPINQCTDYHSQVIKQGTFSKFFPQSMWGPCIPAVLSLSTKGAWP